MSNEWLKLKMIRDVKKIKESNHSLYLSNKIRLNMNEYYH